jgi:hypothetical protein
MQCNQVWLDFLQTSLYSPNRMSNENTFSLPPGCSALYYSSHGNLMSAETHVRDGKHHTKAEDVSYLGLEAIALAIVKASAASPGFSPENILTMVSAGEIIIYPTPLPVTPQQVAPMPA